jgi:hypothetical protein
MSERSSRGTTILFWLIAVIILSGCGKPDSGDPTGPGQPVTPTVTITPSHGTLTALRDTLPFSAVVTNGDASSLQWSTSSAGIATVDATGRAVAVSNGTATITASVSGVSAAATLTVAQEAQSLELIPRSANARVGESVQLEWRAEDRNGFPVEAAEGTLSSSNVDVATVGADAFVRAIRDGQTTIRVAGGGLNAHSTLTVTDDGGEPATWAWSDPAEGVGTTSLHDLWGSDDQHVWAVDDEGILRFDGMEWSRASIPSEPRTIIGIWGTGPSDVWAAGSLEVLHFNGSVWSASFQRTGSAWPVRVWGSAPDDIWAVGRSGTLLHYDGQVWTDAAPDGLKEAGVTLWDTWGVGRGRAWAVGDQGSIWVWDGERWAQGAQGLTGEDLFAIWGSGPRDVWVVGANQTILHWNGDLWRDRSTELTGLGDCDPRCVGLTGVWGTGPNDVWVVGGRATMLRFDGSSWSEPDPGLTDASFRAIWGTARGPIHVATHLGRLLIGRR